MQIIHLDTDLGGDPDDACALTMLLGWSTVELVGITTTADRDGLRAAYTRHLLRLAGREGIPVAAGAGVSLTTLQVADPVISDARHWPIDLRPEPAPAGASLDLLEASIERGATIVAIGPQTNLALMEVARPGTLAKAPVVVMGGWTEPPAAGLPCWGPEMDFNIQWDQRAAAIVAASGDVTFAALPATLKAHLRAADLPRLRASGPLGDLLANQSAAHAEGERMAALGQAYAALPDDLVNFHYDPVAAAVAAGWSGVSIQELRLTTVVEQDALHFRADPAGRLARVVVDLDGAAFSEQWMSAVEAAQRG